MKNDNIQEYSLPFAAWELRLYLDTHPDDSEAFAKYKAICAAAGDKCNYACHTTDTVSNRRSRESGCGCSGNSLGRINSCNNSASNCGGRRNDGGNHNGCGCENSGYSNGNAGHNVWSWIEGPWPWEPDANNVGGNC